MTVNYPKAEKYAVVIFKSGAVVEIPCESVKLSTATEAGEDLKIGDLVGYTFDLDGTTTNIVYLRIQDVSGVVFYGEVVVKSDSVE